MIITWDEPKRQTNIARHAMDFADLDLAFFDNAIIRRSHSRRWLAIGRNANGLIAVVFATLGQEAISVISMRPASRQERKLADG
jgi:uncharacterized DUF497 family protein